MIVSNPLKNSLISQDTTMQLTEEQQDMIDGKHGQGTAIAMKIQVGIGESFTPSGWYP